MHVYPRNLNVAHFCFVSFLTRVHSRKEGIFNIIDHLEPECNSVSSIVLKITTIRQVMDDCIADLCVSYNTGPRGIVISKV